VSGVPDFAARVDGLVEVLSESGDRTTAEWRDALRAAPRHLFVPDVGWALPDFDGKPPYPVDRTRDEDEWLGAVYSDTSIVTQAGDGGVVTVEVDPEVAARARRNLAAAGRSPVTLVDDGADGARAYAPFNRAHVTCGVPCVPCSGVEQTRPRRRDRGAVPARLGYGHKLPLHVTGEGTAVSRFHGPAAYMMMRSQRTRTGRLGFADDDSGEETLWLLETTAAEVSESWALAEYVPGGREYERRRAHRQPHSRVAVQTSAPIFGVRVERPSRWRPGQLSGLTPERKVPRVADPGRGGASRRARRRRSRAARP
jgi:Protein-L-isoaspartate(D-aspartate) O-methyltransferase (PCMT)